MFDPPESIEGIRALCDRIEAEGIPPGARAFTTWLEDVAVSAQEAADAKAACAEAEDALGESEDEREDALERLDRLTDALQGIRRMVEEVLP